MKRTIRQHYVPRSYLAAWCQADGNLWAFDKKSGKSFNVGPDNVALKKGMYDTTETTNPNDQDNFQIYENTFAEIEGFIRPTFNAVIRRARNFKESILPEHSVAVAEEEVIALAQFAIIQMLRDLKFREKVVNNAVSWMKTAWENTAPILFDISHQESQATNLFADKNSVTRFQMNFLATGTTKYANNLVEKFAVVGVSPAGSPLLTSDSPILNLGYVIDPTIAWDGINSPSAQIVYPLAPDVCIIFYDRNFEPYQKQSEYDRRVKLLTRSEIETFNEHTALQSHKQIFSNHANFSKVRRALKKNSRPQTRWKPVRPAISTMPTYLVDELIAQASSIEKGKYTQEEWLLCLQKIL